MTTVSVLVPRRQHYTLQFTAYTDSRLTPTAVSTAKMALQPDDT